MKSLILASTSPRRRELIKKLKIPFKAADSGYQEKKHKHLKPKDLVLLLALGKARAVAKQYPNSVIVGADTVVEYRGQVLGKAKNKAHARRMLQMLNGKANYVITGMVVIKGRRIIKHRDVVKVVFKKYSNAVIEDYIKTGEYADKAGAYGIQGAGKMLIKKVEGDKEVVLGLSIKSLRKILKNLK